MFFKVLISSIILVSIVMLALGIKLWFDPNAKFSSHSCALEDGSLDKDGACSKCELKDMVDCPEEKNNK